MLLSGPNLTLFAEVEDAEPGSPVSRFPRRRFKFPHAGCHPSHGGTHPASDGLPDPARPGAASPGSHAAAAEAPAAASRLQSPRGLATPRRRTKGAGAAPAAGHAHREPRGRAPSPSPAPGPREMAAALQNGSRAGRGVGTLSPRAAGVPSHAVHELARVCASHPREPRGPPECRRAGQSAHGSGAKEDGVRGPLT